MIEPTDENTGLPPLDEPDEEATLLIGVFGSGSADLLDHDGVPQSVFVLSARGMMGDSRDWAQVHLAFPHGSVTGLRRCLDNYLAEHPELA